MITILSGENTYSRNAVLGQLVNAFIKEHGDFGLERLDGEEVEYDRMREALESLEADHAFLLKGDVFTKDQIDAYVELKWEEVLRVETTPCPVEFDMYYSM